MLKLILTTRWSAERTTMHSHQWVEPTSGARRERNNRATLQEIHKIYEKKKLEEKKSREKDMVEKNQQAKQLRDSLLGSLWCVVAKLISYTSEFEVVSCVFILFHFSLQLSQLASLIRYSQVGNSVESLQILSPWHDLIFCDFRMNQAVYC